MNTLKAFIFYWLLRPILNRVSGESVRSCPMCGELLQYYGDAGYLHIGDGDADCYGALNAGKGSFK